MGSAGVRAARTVLAATRLTVDLRSDSESESNSSRLIPRDWDWD
jgi:hypothetical protein